MSRKDEAAAEPEYYGNGACAQEFAHRVCESLAACYTVRQVVEHLVLVVETCAHFVLGIECLDDAKTAESLLDCRHEYAPLGLSFE